LAGTVAALAPAIGRRRARVERLRVRGALVRVILVATEARVLAHVVGGGRRLLGGGRRLLRGRRRAGQHSRAVSDDGGNRRQEDRDPSGDDVPDQGHVSSLAVRSLVSPLVRMTGTAIRKGTAIAQPPRMAIKCNRVPSCALTSRGLPSRSAGNPA